MEEAKQEDYSLDQDKYLEMDEIDDDNMKLYRRALTTKAAVTFLLEGKLKNNVCRYCLNLDSNLTELDRIIHIAVKGVIYNVTVRDMVACFHPVKVVDDPNFPNKICEICLEQTLSSYLFVQQCERAERALRNCFDDMYDKANKLDPLERTKKRGRVKINPNYNIIYTEHENVIDYAEPVINLINTNTELQDLKKPNINQHECAQCWQVYPSLATLVNHEKMHPSSMWFHCRICGRSFAKKGQLKKHIKASHSMKTAINEENITFKCKECGFQSNNYSTHLEHIEKHKFKLALQNIVERKMDKLCSVCLDKGNLKDLDQMICLHGGSPGLTGDVTLYAVLGSIIPNKNTYKYQELHIPTQARVMKYSKRVQLKSQFKLSIPIVVSTSNVKLNGIYKFVFSKPKPNLNDSKESLKNALESNKTNLRADCFHEKDSINKPNNEETKISSNPNYNIAIDTKKDQGEIKLKSCKNCWIFGKKCDECSNKTIDGNTPSIAQCKFCWVFKNAKFCDICKADIIKNTTVTELKIIDKTKANLDEVNDEVIDEEPRRKKSKWQCNICLINNSSDELKCTCCESNNNIRNKHITAFNFPDTKINHYLHNNINCEDTENIEDMTPSHEAIEKTEHKVISHEVENETTPDILLINESTENTSEKTVDNIEHSQMEVESSNIDNIKPKEITIELQQSEFMDTDEHDLINCSKSDELTFSTTVLQFAESTQPNVPLQFHIGTGSSSSVRKGKRPLRRAATSHN